MSNDRPDYRGNPLDFIDILADTAGGLGNWIANGTPTPGSIPGEIQQRYRDHCDSWSNGPSWVQQFDPGARLFLSNACKPWLDSQGSGDPGIVVPITGGQCPGVEYNVRGKVDFSREPCPGSPVGPLSSDVWFQGQLWGPITGPTETVIATSTCGNSTVTRVRLDGFDSSGNPSAMTVDISAGRTDTYLTSISYGQMSFTRKDGQPDTCGNQPGVVAPNPNPRPDPTLDPEDEPFETEPGRPVLPMPPITDPFGEPVQLPNFPLPNIEGPSLFPEDEPPPQAEPGEPGSPEVVGGDEESEGEASEGEILTGVLVEVGSFPSYARTVQNVTTPTYIGACYVYLGWENQLDLQPEGQFLVDGQFFAAIPGMTHWRVRSAVGYTLTITPYYAQKE